VIPFICKEFKLVLDYAMKNQRIIRLCEHCNKSSKDLDDFGLMKIQSHYFKNLFVCVRCRRKCDRCKNWLFRYFKNDKTSCCGRVVCGNCAPLCLACGDCDTCYDCIPNTWDLFNYICKKHVI